MQLRSSVSNLLFGLMLFIVLSSAAGTTQAQQFTSRVGYLQDDAETRQEKPNLDLQEEFEKLEFRLRELEDDFVKQIESPDEDDEESEEPDEEVGERVAELEDAFDDLSTAVDDLDATLPGLVHHGHKSPKIQIFGRVHLDFWGFALAEPGVENLEGGDPQDRFNFRRLRLGVKGDLNDNIFYKYEGEFAGGVDPSYRDAFIGIRDLPLLNTVIIGNHKRPYGYDHLNSSRYNIFIERPLVIEAFNEDARRLGISSNGNTQDLKYNWRYGVWNQRLTQTTDGFIGDHYQLEVAGRLASTPWYDDASGGRGYFHWALAGSVGEPDGTAGDLNEARFRTRPEARSDERWWDTGRIAGAEITNLLGLEAVYNNGPWHFAAEYQRRNVNRDEAFGPGLQFHGGYIYGAYFLTGEHMPFNRKTGTLGRIKPFENFFRVRKCDGKTGMGLGAWQIAARYSYLDVTDQDIIGGDGSTFTAALNWYWNPYTRMQFNYIWGDVNREPLGSGDFQIAGLRLMVDF